MNSIDWQTWAALGIVFLTALIFALKSSRKKKPGSCGSCGCGSAHAKKPLADQKKHIH